MSVSVDSVGNVPVEWRSTLLRPTAESPVDPAAESFRVDGPCDHWYVKNLGSPWPFTPR